MAIPVQRPFGISLISILIIITGVVDIIASVILLIDRNDSDVLSALDVSSSDVTTYAWVSIAIGVIVILIGNALRTGANWARLLVAIIAVIRLITLIWVVAAYHQIHWYHALWPTVIYVFVAGYLFFDEDAKAYYRQLT
jgi:hypothetical protein